MAELLTIPALLSAAGAGVSALGTIAAGNHAKASAEFQAKQMEQQANEERAATQREQMAIRRRAEQAQSRLQAVSARSGLGTLDPTVMELAGDIEAEGAYQRGMAGYAGTTRAQNMELGAQSAIMQGRAAQSASRLDAFGTILGSAASIYDKYSRRSSTAGAGYGYRYG
jgi:hypothetical protein